MFRFQGFGLRVFLGFRVQGSGVCISQLVFR
jgi:hypothetical protein